mmetsp:Transcript_54824/g.117053  ORF Transcript_54824/g.117053 Transcript_54824/m.117053 type:complete len:448 (-) Transcript_54824:121-1464(-)|eukprot:CAMPEP_0206443870 /NCGR_PEP_ID=MMETSP0324_2-20121206/14607_1 /ASSEMBLY_ACC=CAM_ASM_000836 /TAXON_ID=2866 /ORGANISM="Crypthecodinium cohnii, Strain Seligo" /LENGTH=447 /DNA_ID=CAMNT_0053911851 /DNA_START=72 /DNA_END=1415 /DNA_ORIENTATION=+
MSGADETKAPIGNPAREEDSDSEEGEQIDLEGLVKAQNEAGQGGEDAKGIKRRRERKRGGAKSSKKKRQRQKWEEELVKAKQSGHAASLKDVLKDADNIKEAAKAAQSEKGSTAPADATKKPAVPASYSRHIVSYDDAMPDTGVAVTGSAPATSSSAPAGSTTSGTNGSTIRNLNAKSLKDAVRLVEWAEEKDSRTVFVTNLPFKATEQAVRNLLASCGEIESILMSRDKSTSHVLGYMHVTFKEPAAAAKAVETCHKKELQDRVLYVTPAKRGEKVEFELPPEVKEDIRHLVRTDGEGHNLSVIKDRYKHNHGKVLDTAKWGFKKFSVAVTTIDGLVLEVQADKRLTNVIFMRGSEKHKEFLKDKEEKLKLMAQKTEAEAKKAAEAAAKASTSGETPAGGTAGATASTGTAAAPPQNGASAAAPAAADTPSAATSAATPAAEAAQK